MPVVAFQGEAGAYSERACAVLFPDGEYRPTISIRRVFESVEVGQVDFGLVPMDNSQAGSINETYDLFLRHGLSLVGEIAVPVDHCLLGFPGVELDEVTEVISHPQALAQCEEFLSSLAATTRADYDTAGAAKRIVEDGLRTTAAIASRRAADLYGLSVLAERIQTYPDNSTRFGVISKRADPLGTADKTSIVFGVGHVPGCLYRCLGAFAERHLNLTKLESRPRAGRPWEYVFYADIESGSNSPAMIEALTELSSHATFTRVLGSYQGGLAGL
jgi:prephenate dehydratase/chorismate mutase/prephenate dehydratase